MTVHRNVTRKTVGGRRKLRRITRSICKLLLAVRLREQRERA